MHRQHDHCRNRQRSLQRLAQMMDAEAIDAAPMLVASSLRDGGEGEH